MFPVSKESDFGSPLNLHVIAGSQTEIAVVTADFVRIYDLGKDVLSPQYYFLVPSGKIRDCTLAFTEEGKYVIIMSSAGHIYFQVNIIKTCTGGLEYPTLSEFEWKESVLDHLENQTFG